MELLESRTWQAYGGLRVGVYYRRSNPSFEAEAPGPTRRRLLRDHRSYNKDTFRLCHPRTEPR